MTSRREIYQSGNFDPEEMEATRPESASLMPVDERFLSTLDQDGDGDVDWGDYVNWFSVRSIGTQTPEELAAWVKAAAHFRKEREEIDTNMRLMLELKIRHMVGMPIHVILGVIDGILEAGAVAVSEVAETAAFAVSRTTKRTADGFRRGRDG